jgi:peptidoglycan/LPS O-acetylase OafA/YrhL
LKRIPSLDGFRAISIILVLIAHGRYSRGYPFQNSNGSLQQVGLLGVSVFFVISGFLITYLLLTEDLNNGYINIKFFYIRRILRIVPVYALYIILVIFCQTFEHVYITPNDLFHLLTFTTNFHWTLPPSFLHLWTLSIEEQFYFIWPAILIVFRKNLKVVVLIFLIYSCFARVFSYKFIEVGPFILSPFFGLSDTIFIGALGGMLYFENENIGKLKMFSSYTLQLVAVCLIIAFEYFASLGKFGKIALPFGNTIISFSILFLIFAYINPSNKIVFKILNYKTMVHIGVLSYSIYIWQQFFLDGKTGFWRIFPYNMAEIYFIALASYYLWEKPFLRMKEHFSIKRPQPKPDDVLS